MEVTKIFTFDSAHFLTQYYGKCEKIHGHTYKLEVTIEGDVQDNGLVLDFIILKRVVNKHVISKIDHMNLNDILENPSSENLVIWIWKNLFSLNKLLKEEIGDPNLPEDLKQYISNVNDLSFEDFNIKLKELKLWETATSFVTYQGAPNK